MAAVSTAELSFTADPSRPDVSAIWLRPRGAHSAYVFAHGAGAGMQHRFMQGLSEALAEHGVATFRYQFPYMEAGSRRPDAERILLSTVRAAVAAGSARARGLPLFAGGKSMGGRMTSRASAVQPLEPVRGLVFLGFPLHPAGKPADTRAAHLRDVPVPMLFMQGTRDRLADLDLLRPVVTGLGRSATLHIVPGGDHSLVLPKKMKRSEPEVLADVAAVMSEWMQARA